MRMKVHVAAKCAPVEIELDDSEEVQGSRSREARKAGPKDGWATVVGTCRVGYNLKMIGSLRTIDNLLLERLNGTRQVPTTGPNPKKLTASARSPRRGAPPILIPRGMGQQES